MMEKTKKRYNFWKKKFENNTRKMMEKTKTRYNFWKKKFENWRNKINVYKIKMIVEIAKFMISSLRINNTPKQINLCFIKLKKWKSIRMR